MKKIPKMRDVIKLLELVNKRYPEGLTEKEVDKYKDVFLIARRFRLVIIESSAKRRLALTDKGFSTLWNNMAINISKETKKGMEKLNKVSEQTFSDTKKLNKMTTFLLIFTFILVILSISTIINSNHIFNLERELEMNNHINDLRALKNELEMNLDFTFRMENLKDDFLTNPELEFYSGFVYGNLEKMSSDGRIRNDLTMEYLLSSLSRIYELNNVIKGIMYNPDLVEDSIKRISIKTEFFNEMEGSFRGNLTRTINMISIHLECLEIKMNYDECYDPGYTINKLNELELILSN